MPSLTDFGNEIGRSVYKQLVINFKYKDLNYDELEEILEIAANKALELLLKDKAAEREKGKK